MKNYLTGNYLSLRFKEEIVITQLDRATDFIMLHKLIEHSLDEKEIIPHTLTVCVF